MGVFIVLIIIVVIAYFDSKENKKRQQEEQKKLNADISRVESSTFYKQISRFIQETISDYEQEIREDVRREYSRYLKKNSSQPFDCFVVMRHSIGVYAGCISQTDIDDAIHPAFIYSSQGYADLTNDQLYALIKTIQRDFECLRLGVDTDYELKEIIKKQKNSYGSNPIRFHLTESCVNAIKNSEIKKLKTQKSPYKSAF